MTVVLALAAGLLAADLKHYDNFAPNSSFEDDRDRDTRPDGWEGNAFESTGQEERRASSYRQQERNTDIRPRVRTQHLVRDRR
ncbi:MAG: hypothetical protein ACC628_08625 [Pirellulaceae bacterium]